MIDPEKSACQTVHQRLMRDPLWFTKHYLGIDLWDKQVEIMESVRDNPITTARSCHGSGKTYVAAAIALWFLHAHPNALVITTAPTNRQVEFILWKEINRLHRGAKLPLGSRCLTTRLEIEKDWFALGFSPEKNVDASETATKFQGFHAEHVLVIVDEAAGVPNDVFDGIDGVLTGKHSRKLMIGNPTDPSGTFGKSFRDPLITKFKISAFDTPNFTDFGIELKHIRDGSWKKKVGDKVYRFPAQVTPDWVADKIRPQKWGEGSPLWTAKVMGDFPEMGTDTLIPLVWFERARDAKLPDSKDDVLEYGVDVARHGTNETVIAGRKGNKVWIEKRMSGKDTMQTVGEVKALVKANWPRTVRIDEIGVGAGVIDALRTDGVDVAVGVNVGMAPSGGEKDQFVNLRAELYWELRKLFEHNEIQLIGDIGLEDLESQLTSIKFKHQARTGKIQIESKDEMAKRGMPSPDLADAVMLACAHSYGSFRDKKVSYGAPSEFAQEAERWGSPMDDM